MQTKVLLTAFCLTLGMAANAQVSEDQTGGIPNLDTKEDTTEITTLQDIINIQQAVMSRNNEGDHVRKVWGNNTYFKIGYNKTRMATKNPIRVDPAMGGNTDNSGDKRNLEFENDWGASLLWGCNYKLHSTPILDMITINLDFSWLDLNFNHFKAQNEMMTDGKYLYNSTHRWTENSTEYYYKPWGMEMYEANYSMSLGPSISVTPFQALHNNALDFIKINAYWHIGYGVSGIMMPNKDNFDQNTEKDSYHEQMADNLKLDFGHGMHTSFGVGISWKFIGLGYERRKASFEYFSLTKKDYNNEKEKWKNTTNRIFLQFKL